MKCEDLLLVASYDVSRKLFSESTWWWYRRLWGLNMLLISLGGAVLAGLDIVHDSGVEVQGKKMTIQEPEERCAC